MTVKTLDEYTKEELALGRDILDSLIENEKEYAKDMHTNDPEHLEECDCGKVEQYVKFAEYFQEIIDNTIDDEEE